MKKIILLVAVATTISFAACTNKTTAEQPAETVIEEATNEVEEAIEEATEEVEEAIEIAEEAITE